MTVKWLAHNRNAMNIVGGVKLNCKVDNRTLLCKNDYFIDRDLYFEILNLIWSVAMCFMC